MTRVEVDLGDRRYPIDIGSGLLSDETWWHEHANASSVAVVTNETVNGLYAQPLVALLRHIGRRVVSIVLPDGEEHKNWTTLHHVYDGLIAHQCDRQTLVVAVGGGVVGDIAGFAAATYQRGVPFLQVPTTLLAQVDSSVGGKTGINHPSGKNMIGAFHQPKAVLVDVDTLGTLPDREYAAGLAEVIKHGAACDIAYFRWLETHFPALVARHSVFVAEAIAGSCRIKASVVAADEREGGIRAILNFGHTFGHAIETAMGYGCWLHGEAVAAGMMLAAQLSVDLGSFDTSQARRLQLLVEQARLPTHAPGLSISQWQELMVRDKKASRGQIRFVVLRGLGEAYVTPVPEALLTALLEKSMRSSVAPGDIHR